jgi:hypothetical protein
VPFQFRAWLDWLECDEMAATKNGQKEKLALDGRWFYAVNAGDASA